MLLTSLLSLVSIGFGMHIEPNDQPTVLLLGPLKVFSPSLLSSLDDTDERNLGEPSMPSESYRGKRGVDPLSIPRLIKEPPLKKRNGDFKRGDVVYPSAAKQTVPLVRVREPPLKRGHHFLEELLQSNDDVQKRFMNPLRRIRYGLNRRVYAW